MGLKACPYVTMVHNIAVEGKCNTHALTPPPPLPCFIEMKGEGE